MLRWRKNPRPKGLAGVVCGHPGHTLWKDRTIECASVDQLQVGHSRNKWYWVAGWDSGVPHKNTCYEPVDTEAEAKTQAMAYVKQHITNACTKSAADVRKN